MEVSVGIRATLDDARLSTQPHTLLTIRHLPKADKDVHPAPPNSLLLPIALTPSPWVAGIVPPPAALPGSLQAERRESPVLLACPARTVLSFIARRTRSFAQYRTDTEKERARLKLNLGIGDSQVAWGRCNK